MEDQLNHIVYSKGVIEFVAVSTEYCRFIEQIKTASKSNFVNISQKILPLLYLKTVTLPDFENNFEQFNEKFVTESDWEYYRNKIAEKLGENETFMDVYDPTNYLTGEAINVSVSECFTDIYQDLKNFTMNYKIGTIEAMNDSLWECKNNFEQYWGSRLLVLLTEIHNIFYSFDDLDIEEEINNDTEKPEVDTADWIINQRFSDFDS